MPSVPVLWLYLELVPFYIRRFGSSHHTEASVRPSCFGCQPLRDETLKKAKQHAAISRKSAAFDNKNSRRLQLIHTGKSWMISYWNLFKCSEAVNTASHVLGRQTHFLYSSFIPQIVLVHFPQLKAILLNTHSISLLCKYESKNVSWGDCIIDLFDQFQNISSHSNGLFVFEHSWNENTVGKRKKKAI